MNRRISHIQHICLETFHNPRGVIFPCRTLYDLMFLEKSASQSTHDNMMFKLGVLFEMAFGVCDANRSVSKSDF